MIVVAGRVFIKPEHRVEAIERAKQIARDSEGEDGCISYRIYSDLEDPNLFFIFEEWRSADDLAAHFQTPHLKAFQQHIARLIAEPLAIKQYEVSSVGKA